MEVNLPFTLRIIVDHPKTLRIISLPNLNLIGHFFHKNRVELILKFGGELFPPPSYRHSYPCLQSPV